MPRFSAQVRQARQSHVAVDALEAAARSQIEQAFDAWDAGTLNAVTVRYRLERTVRDAYRSSVALAVEHVRRQTEELVPGWKPQERVFVTPYLTSLVKDVRRNLRDYKSAGKTPEARRRALLRMKHSAGVAAQRGYTDALVSAYQEMEDLGLVLRKVWVANLLGGHIPCQQCIDLHGTEVGLHEEFPSAGFTPYIDLVGPPAHPHCQCWLVVLVVTLENAFDTLDVGQFETQPENTSMTSSAVRSMPAAIFAAFLAFLAKVLGLLKGGS